MRSFSPNDASGVGVARFSRPANAPKVDAGLDRNCADFTGGFEAQQFFMNNGGPARDPHDLDRDGDGYACEWGTELRQRAAAAERQAAVARAATQRRVAAASRCYTGPRGGTYTITASGARDYDGC
nr:excalibur calcium-binding domain-containing protein [Jannaschia rubra]